MVVGSASGIGVVGGVQISDIFSVPLLLCTVLDSVTLAGVSDL